MIKKVVGSLAFVASSVLSNSLLAQTFVFEYAGEPVADVRVTQSGQLVAVSDRAGEVQIKSCLNSLSICDLVFSHPNYAVQNLIIEPGLKDASVNDGELESKKIILQAISTNIEELLVTSRRDTPTHFDELNTANSRILLSDKVDSPSSILDVITDIPGIAENGQGGLFQVYSIRGLSRQRVSTYLGQIPLKAERRAGVASSFLHPLLFSSVQAQRGPASTVYLSGSLGGVVQLAPRQFEQNVLQLDYDSVGQRNQQLFGTQLRDWSFGIARQSAQKSKDVEGNELNDAYDQYSASLIKEWRVKDLEIVWTNLLSLGDDIGRSSTRFPERIVTVPEEQHWLSQIQLLDEDWELSVFTHLNEVSTLTVRPENRTNLVDNEASDFGASYKRYWNSESFSGIWGLDYFTRIDVNASDLLTSLSDGTQSLSRSLINASEEEVGLYATVDTYLGNSKFQFGGRLIQHHAKNGGTSALELGTLDDTAVTAFIGVSRPLSSQLFFTANLGTGVRFPTLSERFFTGTTGRGEVIGNSELKEETSVSLDAGLKYQTAQIQISTNVYQQKISDYIERLEVEPELLSFRNLNDGTITGFDLESSFSLLSNWQTKLSLSVLDGEDELGNPLIDIPANRLNLSNDYQWRDWGFSSEFEFRKSKSSVASGEQATDSVLITNIGSRYDFSEDLSVSFYLNNLFDRKYFNSQDELVPFAAGRNFSLAASYSW